MKTLILKKEVKGYYSNQIDNIRISVSECFDSWTGTIENLDANCEKFAVYTCYGKTKKEVTNQLINFIINF